MPPFVPASVFSIVVIKTVLSDKIPISEAIVSAAAAAIAVRKRKIAILLSIIPRFNMLLPSVG